jgi:hypothetical protein
VFENTALRIMLAPTREESRLGEMRNASKIFVGYHEETTWEF